MLRPRLSCCVGLLASVWVIVEYITVGGWASSASLIPACILPSFTVWSRSRPICSEAAFGGLTNETKLVPLSDDDRLIILVWRVKLMLLGLLESEFGLGALLIEFDA